MNTTHPTNWHATTAPTAVPHATAVVLAQVAGRRREQDKVFGEQNHPDGTGPDVTLTGLARRAADAAWAARFTTEMARAEDRLTWLHILREEVYEALAEADPQALRDELLDVAATAVVWIEAIDRRRARPGGRG
ncbi:hypothetical protein [Amycolatopsis sp. CA-128772]|uniref:hypothetical protein n=1 Tax=Amycolatopsis sp. CA-128772 TaxID=2073159 RepID=UPI001E414FE4|nr:hypothetical protein [Amycolatopsis sp. CA-128772]